MILGINVGRVLINATDDKAPDTSFIGGSLEDALRTLPYEGMFAVVPRLARKFEGARLDHFEVRPSRTGQDARVWLSRSPRPGIHV
jgi:hypothetical protein